MKWKKIKANNEKKMEQVHRAKEQFDLQTRKVKVFKALKPYFVQQYKGEQVKSGMELRMRR